MSSRWRKVLARSALQVTLAGEGLGASSTVLAIRFRRSPAGRYDASRRVAETGWQVVTYVSRSGELAVAALEPVLAQRQRLMWRHPYGVVAQDCQQQSVSLRRRTAER